MGRGRGNDVMYSNKASLLTQLAPYLGTLHHFLYHTPQKPWQCFITPSHPALKLPAPFLWAPGTADFSCIRKFHDCVCETFHGFFYGSICMHHGNYSDGFSSTAGVHLNGFHGTFGYMEPQKRPRNVSHNHGIFECNWNPLCLCSNYGGK